MRNDQTLTGELAKLVDVVNALSTGVPSAAQSDPREEVIIRYTVGKGRFMADGKYIILQSRMYKLNGEEDGHHEGVFESAASPTELMQWVEPPSPPLDQPRPVEHPKARAFTKAIWTFGDGSSITAVGPAMVHLAPFADGSGMFFVSVGASITNGTGRFEGALGIKTALGSTRLEQVKGFGPGVEFPGITIETFRVINKRDLA